MPLNSGFDAPRTPETPTLPEMDKRIITAADCLRQMDDAASHYSIDSSGRITGLNLPHSIDVRDPNLNRNLKNLLARFSENNSAYAKYLSRDPAVLDVRVISGCVVMVYDSSKHFPVGFSGEENRGSYNGATEVYIEDENGFSKKIPILGLVTVDLNPANRWDNVDPGTTLRHELDHHNLAVTDYLLAVDPDLRMNSAYRKGRKTALFGDDRHRLTTSQAFAADLSRYALLASRDNSQITEHDLIQQQAYLDELHSFIRQRHPDWISAQGSVYSTDHDPHHRHPAWEVVGDHPADAESTKQLLTTVQAAFICEQMVPVFRSLPHPTEGQQQLMVEIPELLNRMSALIGTSRTVAQAERLVAAEWNKFASSPLGQKFITDPQFSAYREQVYQSGFATPSLPVLFQRSTPKII